MAYGAECRLRGDPDPGHQLDSLPLDFESADANSATASSCSASPSVIVDAGSDATRPIEVARAPDADSQVTSLLANVDGAMNAVAIRSANAVGPTLYYGAGAGEMPTASAVVGDLMEIAREVKRGQSRAAWRRSRSSQLDAWSPRTRSATLDETGRASLRSTSASRRSIAPACSAKITGVAGRAGRRDRVRSTRESRAEPAATIRCRDRGLDPRSARGWRAKTALKQIDGALPRVRSASSVIRVEAPRVIRIEEDV